LELPEPFRPDSRLRHRGEFTAVQASSRRVAARFVTLLGRPNTCGRDRLGIIASRRLGSAVARNRAKRRLRELFRRRLAEPVGQATPLDIVAIPRREANDALFDALAADFHNALRKLRGDR
jgi:ribonuclease P protein component